MTITPQNKYIKLRQITDRRLFVNDIVLSSPFKLWLQYLQTHPSEKGFFSARIHHRLGLSHRPPPHLQSQTSSLGSRTPPDQ